MCNVMIVRHIIEGVREPSVMERLKKYWLERKRNSQVSRMNKEDVYEYAPGNEAR